MQRLQLECQPGPFGMGQSFDVPDITTALIVADINMTEGTAHIRDGERLVATLKKRSGSSAPYWHVS